MKSPTSAIVLKMNLFEWIVNEELRKENKIYYRYHFIRLAWNSFAFSFRHLCINICVSCTMHTDTMTNLARISKNISIDNNKCRKKSLLRCNLLPAIIIHRINYAYIFNLVDIVVLLRFSFIEGTLRTIHHSSYITSASSTLSSTSLFYHFNTTLLHRKASSFLRAIFYVYINHRQGVINCGIATQACSFAFSTRAGSRPAADRQEFSSIHLLSLFTLIFHCYHGTLLPHLKVFIFFFFISFGVVWYKRKTIDSRCAHWIQLPMRNISDVFIFLVLTTTKKQCGNNRSFIVHLWHCNGWCDNIKMKNVNFLFQFWPETEWNIRNEQPKLNFKTIKLKRFSFLMTFFHISLWIWLFSISGTEIGNLGHAQQKSWRGIENSSGFSWMMHKYSAK